MFRKALIAATFATATLITASAGASTALTGSSIQAEGWRTTAAGTVEKAVVRGGDFTQHIQLAAGRSDYERCARFSIAVYNACLDQAKSNSQAIRSCRRSYQGNVTRCQALAR